MKRDGRGIGPAERDSPRPPWSVRLVGALVALALALALATAAEATDLEDLSVVPDGSGLRVSVRLADAFPEEILARVRSGLEVSFEYTFRLRRTRSRFADKTVSERYVVVSVRYSNLTKMYRLTRLIDGAVVDVDVTDQPEFMRAWMTEVERLRLFDERDLDEAGTYYVRVRARLLSRFALLVIPWDLETPWLESPRLRHEGASDGSGNR